MGLSDAGKKKYKKYLLGMKQRLGIAAAILGKPEIVIFDEPTNALDDAGKEMVKKVIAEQNIKNISHILYQIYLILLIN